MTDSRQKLFSDIDKKLGIEKTPAKAVSASGRELGIVGQAYKLNPLTAPLAYLAEQYTPEQRESFAGALSEVPTYGFGDEMLAGLATPLPYLAMQALGNQEQKDKSIGDVYSDILAGYEADRQRLKEQAPDAYMAGELAGIPVGIATTGGLGLGKAATDVAAKLPAIGKAITSSALPAQIARGAAAGVGSGAAYRAGTETGTAGERLDKATDIEDLGIDAALGMAIPGAQAVKRGAQRALVPKIDEATRTLAKRAKQFNIPLRADQISESRFRKTLQKVAQESPYSGSAKFEEKQRTAWNKALAKTIGEDAETITPDVINSFLKRTQREFAQSIGKYDIPTDSIKVRINDLLDSLPAQTDDQTIKIVQENVQKLLPDLDGVVVPGKKIAAARSRIVQRLPKIQGAAKMYVGDIVGYIDDAAYDVIPAAGKKKLAQARRHWRNYKTIQPLLSKSPDGTVNPTQLLNRVASSRFIDPSKIATGQDELVDLARIGKEFLPVLGGSDTAQKMALQRGIATAAIAPTAAVSPATAASAAAGFGALRGAEALNQSQRLVGRAIESTPSAAVNIPASVAASPVLAKEALLEPEQQSQSRSELFDSIDMMLEQGQPPGDVLPEQPQDQSQLPDSLMQNEGQRFVAYDDTSGNRTVGIGFNMDSGIARKVWKQAGVQRSFDDVYKGRDFITEPESRALAMQSLQIATDDARKLYDNFDELPAGKQEALIDMSYNLGLPNLSKFRNFNAAVNNGDWYGAVKALSRSEHGKNHPNRERIRFLARKLMEN